MKVTVITDIIDSHPISIVSGHMNKEECKQWIVDNRFVSARDIIHGHCEPNNYIELYIGYKKYIFTHMEVV